MNILTFDIEEWYDEKEFGGNRTEVYKVLDRYLKSILDLLDEQNLKATFFCVGKVAHSFPAVVKSISEKGHEIGCHSNSHILLSKLNMDQLYDDTSTAIKTLEDVIGEKIVSYRAPAFSIGEKNKCALEVLAECGIERDASIYPANRDFGGFPEFPSSTPCIIKVGDKTLKEFPICTIKFAGKDIAYSGGGYFRFFPFGFIKNTMKNSCYAMTYFHIDDIQRHYFKMVSKGFYESYFRESGTFKNRFVRTIKSSLGTKGAFDKMCKLVRVFDYVNLKEADERYNWGDAKVIEL